MLSHGRYPDVTLVQARQKRDEARSLLAEGGGPKAD
ncbi:Arm DNA-binding domain-containing protein [uncultured Roseobacter sp.]